MQIKRNEPTTTHLVSEPAACPYCVQDNFGVTYKPPPWRAGIGSEGSVSVLAHDLSALFDWNFHIIIPLPRVIHLILAPRELRLRIQSMLRLLMRAKFVGRVLVMIIRKSLLLVTHACSLSVRKRNLICFVRSNPSRLGSQTSCSTCSRCPTRESPYHHAPSWRPVDPSGGDKWARASSRC